MFFLLREKVTTLPGGIKAFGPKARKKGEKVEKRGENGRFLWADETLFILTAQKCSMWNNASGAEFGAFHGSFFLNSRN